MVAGRSLHHQAYCWTMRATSARSQLGTPMIIFIIYIKSIEKSIIMIMIMIMIIIIIIIIIIIMIIMIMIMIIIIIIMIMIIMIIILMQTN